MGIILAHFGRFTTLETLRQVSGVSRDCVNAPDLLRIAAHFGLESTVKRCEPDGLAAMGLPLVVFLDFIHFTVVEGIDEDGVALNDPGFGRHRMPRETFAESFTGIALGFRPGPDFRPGGKEVPLSHSIARQVAFCPNGSVILAALAGLAAPLPILCWLVATGLGALVPEGAQGIAWAVIALLTSGGLCLAASLATARLESGYRQARLVDLTRHILAQPFAFFVYRVAPVLTRRVLGQLNLAEIIFRDLRAALLAAVFLPMLLLGLILLHAPIGIIAVLVSSAALYGLAMLARAAGKQGRALQDERDAQWLKLSHRLENFESFKTSAGDDEAFLDMMGLAAEKLEVRQRVAPHRVLAELTPEIALLILLPIAVGCLALLPNDPAAGPWHAIAILCLVAGLRLPLRAFASLHGRIETLQLTLPALDDLLDSAPADPEPDAGTVETGSDMILRIEGACFGFSQAKPALLTDIGFSIARGEWLAITGRSGGGKSTLVGLAIGLHRPWSGTVSFAGRPMQEIGRIGLSRRIGWVNKQGFFVPGTLRDNIRLWDPAITEADIDLAVADSCLADVIAGLPGGLDGVIGARAETLSGGQRQRVEIARALARNPWLLVLDEATDGLDADTEARLFEALRRRGVAVLVVSHRASTIRACDRAMRLVDGRLVEAVPTRNNDEPEPLASCETMNPFSGPATPKDVLDGRIGPPGALFAALTRVAMASGLPPPSAPEHGADQSPPETPVAATLRALARHNGLAARAVRFSVSAWRARDHGSLIGFHRDDGRPLAILADGRSAPKVVDPREGEGADFTVGAEHLSPVAYCLYPSNRAGVLRPKDLLTRPSRPIRDDLAWLIAGTAALPLLASLTPILALTGLAPDAPLQGPGLTLWLSALALVMGSALVAMAAIPAVQTRIEGILDLTANTRLYRHLMRLRPLSVSSLTPERIHRAVLSVPALLALPREGLVRRLCGMIGIVACLVIILWHSLDLAILAAMLVLPLPAVVALILARRRAPASAWLENHAQSQEMLARLLLAAGKLHQSARDAWALAAWREQIDKARGSTVALLRLDAMLAGILSWFPWAATLVFLGALGDELGGGLGSDEMIALAIAFLLGALFTADLSQAAATLAQAEPALSRLRILLKAPTDPAPPRRPRSRTMRGAPLLALDRVSHAYPGRPCAALLDISLRVEAGEIIALTGPTGCGKTTLLRLVLGFMPPESGVILRDGLTEAEGTLSVWRDEVGAVLQDDQLETAMTVRGHIGGKDGFTLAEIREAARRAQLEGDLDAMPMGIQTIVDSERVSTGQKQRILIARRLVRRPRLLILDEATNALSDPMQADLFAELRALGLSVLIVTHRESALALADRVYRMEAGRIVSHHDARTPSPASS